MQWRRDIGRSVAYVNSITSGDANVQSSRFRASIYYDIKTFHIVARASCTSPLKPFHTVYHTQYIFIHVPLWITFWQGFVPPCKEGVIAVESLPKTRFDSIRLQCSRTHNTFKNIVQWKRNFGKLRRSDSDWIGTFYISIQSSSNSSPLNFPRKRLSISAFSFCFRFVTDSLLLSRDRYKSWNLFISYKISLS